MVPNRNAVGLCAVLLGMWYAGLTQNNGAAYLLCFVLTSVALVSIAHAWANLRGLRVEAHLVRSVFAGEEVAVNVRLSSDRQRLHGGVRVAPVGRGTRAEFPAVPAAGAVEGRMLVVAKTRGVFATLPVRIESHYPLGFFTARTALDLAAPHHVYPAPLGELPLPINLAAARSGSGGARAGGDDFAGVRFWRAGESQRHIDWKAVARGQPLVIKEWSGDADTTVNLDWAALPALAPEARLSQLARWVVRAERDRRPYALRLPGVTIPAACGETHFHACLRRLAEFRAEFHAAEVP